MTASDAARGGPSTSQQAMDTQTGLLPYALMAFAVSLPIYVWAGGHAPNAAWMSASFVVFAIAWGLFYAVVNWLREPEAQDLKRRAPLQSPKRTNQASTRRAGERILRTARTAAVTSASASRALERRHWPRWARRPCP